LILGRRFGLVAPLLVTRLAPEDRLAKAKLERLDHGTAAAEEKPKSGRTEGDARTYADNAICLEHCFYTHFTQGTYYMGTKVKITKENI